MLEPTQSRALNLTMSANFVCFSFIRPKQSRLFLHPSLLPQHNSRYVLSFPWPPMSQQKSSSAKTGAAPAEAQCASLLPSLDCHFCPPFIWKSLGNLILISRFYLALANIITSEIASSILLIFDRNCDCVGIFNFLLGSHFPIPLSSRRL